MWLLLSVVIALGWAGEAFAGPSDDMLDAAHRGDAAAVRALLDRGALISADAPDGTTALVEAADHGYLDVVAVLVEEGVSVHLLRNFVSPLYAASAKGHVDVVRFLLAHGANADARGNFEPALVAASRAGHFEVVQLLLANRADVRIAGQRGTALFSAFTSGHFKVVQLLLANGADIAEMDPQPPKPQIYITRLPQAPVAALRVPKWPTSPR